MTDHSTIELVVMRRVRLIRMLALIISTVTLAVLTFIAALWGIGREVWVAHVFENMPSGDDPLLFLNFWFAAFTNTHLVVQVLTALTVISLLFLIREVVRTAHSFFSAPPTIPH